MISKSFFRNSDEYTVSSYQEMVLLCQTLRFQYPTKPFTIYIKGKDNEIDNLKFPFSYFHIVSLKGSLSSSLYAKMKDKDGNELTTWKTAALKVTGSHNLFENLNIQNISGQPEIKGQEVALGVYGDDNLFLNCEFRSTQDTLFVGPLPDDLCTRYIDFLPQDERYFDGNSMNHFHKCNIYGSIDFIFGAGRAVFDNCNLITVKDARKESYVVAPSHSLKDDFGYLFYQCNFMHEEGIKEETIFLARPWRDYGKAVFAYCKYDNHISPLAFHDWSDVNRTRTARFEEYPRQEGRVSWTYNKMNTFLPDKYTESIKELRNACEDEADSI
jgi:pectinesterase